MERWIVKGRDLIIDNVRYAVLVEVRLWFDARSIAGTYLGEDRMSLDVAPAPVNGSSPGRYVLLKIDAEGIHAQSCDFTKRGG